MPASVELTRCSAARRAHRSRTPSPREGLESRRARSRVRPPGGTPGAARELPRHHGSVTPFRLSARCGAQIASATSGHGGDRRVARHLRCPGDPSRSCSRPTRAVFYNFFNAHPRADLDEDVFALEWVSTSSAALHLVHQQASGSWVGFYRRLRGLRGGADVALGTSTSRRSWALFARAAAGVHGDAPIMSRGSTLRCPWRQPQRIRRPHHGPVNAKAISWVTAGDLCCSRIASVA